MTAMAMPFECKHDLLHVPLHSLLKSIDAETSRSHRRLQVAAKRWVDFADRSQRGPDAHSHRLPRPLVTVTGEAIASAEAKRGGQLGRDEVALLAESRCLAKVRCVLGVCQVGLEFREAPSVGITGFPVEVRASIACVGTRCRATGSLDKIKDVDFSARRHQQRGEVTHSLGVRHCGGLAPPAKQPDASIATKLTSVR
jgi:hypothetical protein